MYNPRTSISPQDIEIAREITRTTSTNGWKEIKLWIEQRITNLTESVVNSKTVPEITKTEVKNTKTKTEITVFNVSNNIELAEIRTYKMFLKKISDWEKIAMDNK